MNQLIETEKDFLALNLDAPPGLITFDDRLEFSLRKTMVESESFPHKGPREPGVGYHYKGFKLSDGHPRISRKVYVHPGWYSADAFNDDVKNKVASLRFYLRKGGFLICKVNANLPESVYTASCMLGFYYSECHNREKTRSPMRDVTLVPFPYLITEQSVDGNRFPYKRRDQKWIWVARWVSEDDTIPQVKMDRITAGNNEFPVYDSECFPVIPIDQCILENNKTGIIAFAVRMMKGAVIVVPSSMDTTQLEKALIDINASETGETRISGLDVIKDILYRTDNKLPIEVSSAKQLKVTKFPTIINLSDNTPCVELNNGDIKINALAFLRFLVLLDASRNGYWAYDKSGMYLLVDDRKEAMPLGFIFKQRDLDEYPENLTATINPIATKLGVRANKTGTSKKSRLESIELTFAPEAKAHFKAMTIEDTCMLSRETDQNLSALTRLISE